MLAKPDTSLVEANSPAAAPAETRIVGSRTAIERLLRRNRFNWLYLLLYNIGGQFLEPRSKRYWEWTVFTIANISLCLVRLYLDLTLKRSSALTPRRVRLQISVKLIHSFLLSWIISVTYRKYGFDETSFVVTIALVAYTLGAVVALRANLRILQAITLAYLVLPALTALWIGGIAGYAIGAQFIALLIFCFHEGRVSNKEFWEVLHLNRDLQIARRRVEASAEVKAELIAKHTRQSVIAGERARIAAEWHDTLLAGFSAISWQLDMVQHNLPPDAPEAAKGVSLARTILNHYRTESRLVIADMQTGIPEQGTLQAAVTSALSALAKGRTTKIQVISEGEDLPVSNSKAHQFLRICQEAVSNALQHALPQSITVKIRNDQTGTFITVQDDGAGFNPQTAVAGHYGLQIMKQRARQIGGSLEIQSQPGVGTILTLRVPSTADGAFRTHASVLIVEDQFFARLALRSVLQSREDFTIIGEAETGRAAISLFRQHKPDVTLIDLRLPDITGFDVIKAIRAFDPAARIVVVSNLDSPDDIDRATAAGASAYLTKDASSTELLQAIASVVAAKKRHPALEPETLASEKEVADSNLTPHERDVLEHLVLGLNNGDIALRLGTSEKVVRNHLQSIISKLNATDRTHAAALALHRNIVDLPAGFAAKAASA
jgi:DNA-binding NarL/FixJ family response regulator/signal transduction histidine kinase